MWNFIVVYLLLLLQLSRSQNDAQPGSLNAFEALDDLRTQSMSGHTPTIDEIMRVMATAQPGTSYPTLSAVPETSFSCDKVNQSGYYADPEAGCQVYRQCVPGGPMYSFLCPNKTLFNQVALVCDWWYNVNCDKSTAYYSYSNPRVYQEHVLFLYDGNRSSSPRRSDAVGVPSQFEGATDNTDSESTTQAAEEATSEGGSTEAGAEGTTDETTASSDETSTEASTDTETTEGGTSNPEETTTSENQETTTEADPSATTAAEEATTEAGADETTEGVLSDSGSGAVTISPGEGETTESTNGETTTESEVSTSPSDKASTETSGSDTTETADGSTTQILENTSESELTTLTPGEEAETTAAESEATSAVNSETTESITEDVTTESPAEETTESKSTTTVRAGIIFTIPPFRTTASTISPEGLRIGRMSRALVGFSPSHSTGNEIQPTVGGDRLTTIYPTNQIQQLYSAKELDSSLLVTNQQSLRSTTPSTQSQLLELLIITSGNTSQLGSPIQSGRNDSALIMLSGRMDIASENHTDHTADFWGSTDSHSDTGSTGNDQEPTTSAPWESSAQIELDTLSNRTGSNLTMFGSAGDRNVSSTLYVVNLTDILAMSANGGNVTTTNPVALNVHSLEIGDSISSSANDTMNSTLTDMFGNIASDFIGNYSNSTVEAWTLPISMDLWLNSSDAMNNTAEADISQTNGTFWSSPSTTKSLRSEAPDNGATIPDTKATQSTPSEFILAAVPSRNFSSGLESASSAIGKSIGDSTGTLLFAFIPDGASAILSNYTNLNALLLALQSTLSNRLQTNLPESTSSNDAPVLSAASTTTADRLTVGPMMPLSGSFGTNNTTLEPWDQNQTLTTASSQVTDASLSKTNANVSLQIMFDVQNITLLNATVYNVTVI